MDEMLKITLIIAGGIVLILTSAFIYLFTARVLIKEA